LWNANHTYGLERVDWPRLVFTNRITTVGFAYDAANRLVQVRTDDNNTVIATYTYDDSNERLMAEEGSLRTYYVGGGAVTIAEYIDSGAKGSICNECIDKQKRGTKKKRGQA